MDRIRREGIVLLQRYRQSFLFFSLFSAVLLGCSESDADGPMTQRSIVDAGGLDAAMATGLECLVDDDCESAERCKHFGETSECVLGCGSDDDCPSVQPTCELFGSGDGICIRRCRTDGMCGEDEVCETRDEGFGACIPSPPEDTVGFGGSMAEGGRESGPKFQCSTDANCPNGYRCVDGEDGNRFCEEEEAVMMGEAGAGGQAGSGGAAGSGGDAVNGGDIATGGESGVEAGTSGESGAGGGSSAGGSGGMGASIGTGGNGEGGSAGAAASMGMGGSGEAGETGGDAGAGGDGGNAGNEAGADGSGAGDNPLDASDTLDRGYIHLAEVDSNPNSSFPEMFGNARFGYVRRLGVPVNEDDIWPSHLRVAAETFGGAGACSFYDDSSPQSTTRFTYKNVGTIFVDGASSFELAPDLSADDSYTLDIDSVFNIFDGTGDSIQLSADGADLGGFEVTLPSPEVLTEVSLGGSIQRSGQQITWSRGNGDYVRIKLRAGAQTVECDSPDDGSIELLGTAIAALGSVDNAVLTIERVIERGILTEPREAAVEIRISSSVQRNVVFE